MGICTIGGIEHVVRPAERAVLLIAILHLDHAANAKYMIARKSNGKPVKSKTCFHVSNANQPPRRANGESPLDINLHIGHV